MFDMPLKKNGYTVVVGMGVTGFSVAQFLFAQNMPFIVFDTREDEGLGSKFKAAFSGVELYFDTIDQALIEDAKQVVVSPGVSVEQDVIKYAHECGKPVIGDIDLFLSYVVRPVIGITGSNGKSTITTMVGLALENAGHKVGVGGNIGIPALDLLQKECDVYVLELSSFQLETIERPTLDVACILNISEDHMDRYHSFDDYVAAKHKIYKGAKRIVYCFDDEKTYPSDMHSIERLGFGLEPRHEKPFHTYFFDPSDGFLKCGNRLIIHKDEILIKGKHNLSNVLALFAIAKQFGVSENSCVDVLHTFSGLPHRCQSVTSSSNVTYINDSKATNVGAAIAAIEGLVEEFDSITLIAGGDAKGAEFSDFGEVLNRCVSNIILIGRDAPKIYSHIEDHIEAKFCNSMSDAVAMAKAITPSGGAVLLSPACASFDMFDSYDDRGNQFVAAVNEVCQ